MNYVFVVDKNKQPLMPCHPARARELLKNGKAAVYRHEPFTLILSEREGGAVQPTEVKIDPGANTTGVAVVVEGKRGQKVVWAGEIKHRGTAIRAKLHNRRALRRSRRQRKTRYRAARFNNRRRAEGWLPPSLKSRLNNLMTWVKRLMRWCAVSGIGLERAKFDTQLLHKAEISGVEYQRGELHGVEVREYLLEKWGRKCAYCGKAGVPLEIEHIVPRSRGGSDRVSNLTLACHGCNQRKGNKTAEEFGLPNLQSQAMQPLKDAAALNTTRWALWERLSRLGLPITAGTGGRTKFNREQQGYPKAHWIDAACVGLSGQSVHLQHGHRTLVILAIGRQNRQMTLVDRFGFPRSKAKPARFSHGFQSGDLARAEVSSGKRAGSYRGRVAIKSSGAFTVAGTPDISWKYCRRLQCADGYAYQKGESAVSSIA